jgi:enoyl-CoA hydratase/carnithine racemase
MKNVALEINDGIAIIRFDNGVTNAISPALLADVELALAEVKAEARGLVIAGGSKFFSIGFDLPSLLPLDREGMMEFYAGFNRLTLDVYTLPMPTVCAIGGHATAGGNIFAMACDYRFMAEGRKLIGVNEVNLGIPVTYLSDLILRQLVGDRGATEMVYSGDMLSSERACQIGLVDEVLTAEELEPKALEKVSTLAQKPSFGFSQLKDNRVEQVCSWYEKNGHVKDEIFVDGWFRPEAQELLKEAAKKF